MNNDENNQKYILIILALVILGKVMSSVPKFPNWAIPITLTGISCITTPLIFGGYTPYNLLLSIVLVGLAVYGNQLWKQSMNAIDEIENKEEETNE